MGAALARSAALFGIVAVVFGGFLAVACGSSGGSAGCKVNGGGRSGSPDGLGCSVTVRCGSTEYQLVCNQNATTCDCEMNGTSQQSIPADPKYCVVPADGGVGPQMQLANQACGWNADLGAWANR